MDPLFEDYDGFAPKDNGRYKKSTKRNKRAKSDNNNKAPEQSFKRPPLQLVDVSPKTDNQKRAFDGFRKDFNMLLYGTAGTGKTFISMYFSLKAVMEPNSEFQKVVIVRSMAPTKDSGFLPGTLAEKSKIYELPYIGICAELFGRADAYEQLKKMGMIEFTTTSYLRGLTMRDSIVILDEFQNGTMHEIHTVITRIGENCRVIVSGDTKQTDLTKKYEVSGGIDAIRIIRNMPSFKNVEFDVDDIVRNGMVREWILSREKLEL